MKKNIFKLNDENVRKIAYAGIFTAAIAFVSAYIRIPTLNGYAHVGDGLIYLAAALLGPFAAFPAAVGSMLADIIAGCPQYIVPSLIIKGLMGLISGLVFRGITGKVNGRNKKAVIWLATIAICEAVMVFGYHISGEILYGKEAAIGELVENVCQAIVGVIMGMIFMPISKYFKRKKKNENEGEGF